MPYLKKGHGSFFKRKDDGRWMGKFTVAGVQKQTVIGKDWKKCLAIHYEKVEELKKQNVQVVKTRSRVNGYTLFSWLNEWNEMYVKGGVKKNGKPLSKSRIKSIRICIDIHVKDNFEDKPLSKLTVFDLERDSKKISSSRMREDTDGVLFKALSMAHKKGLMKENIVQHFSKHKHEREEGEWFDPEQQKLLLENKDKCTVWKEVVFYLMTGCRCEEGVNVIPHFDKCAVWVDRSKVDGTSGYVKLSQAYTEMLKKAWPTMFRYKSEYYSRTFSKFLRNVVKIEDKTLHDLRHTFSTNLGYLGCPPKEHQYLMGHKSIKMTYELYTSFDPFIKKEHITEIWGDLVLTFNNKVDTRNNKFDTNFDTRNFQNFCHDTTYGV